MSYEHTWCTEIPRIVFHCVKLFVGKQKGIFCMFPDVSRILLHVCLVSLPDVQQIQSSMHQVFFKIATPLFTSTQLFLLVYCFFFACFFFSDSKQSRYELSVDPQTTKWITKTKNPEALQSECLKFRFPEELLTTWNEPVSHLPGSRGPKGNDRLPCYVSFRECTLPEN